MTAERWKKVPGWPYEASNHGRVRRARTGHVLAYEENRDGYPVTKISKGGDRRRFAVHQLVAAAFLGPCPEGLEVNHKNGDKRNNSPDNLQYVTRSGNMKHAFEEGLHSNEAALEAWRVARVKIECVECGTRFERRETDERRRIESGQAGPFCGLPCSTVYAGRMSGLSRLGEP